MRSELLPWWLRSTDLTVIGFEGDSDDDDAEETDEDAEEDEDDDDDSSDDDSKQGKGKKNTDNAGLKSALEKERKERRKLEKEAKKLRKAQEEAEDKDKSDSEKANKAKDKAEEKAVRLAAKLKTNAVNTQVMKFANKLGFRDVDDAISLIDMKLIDVDQDDDDPSDIEIDEKSVERAVKQLAKSKPHLVKGDSDSDDDDEDDEQDDNANNRRSGSKFNGKRKNKKGPSEQDLRSKYSALGPPRT